MWRQVLHHRCLARAMARRSRAEAVQRWNGSLQPPLPRAVRRARPLRRVAGVKPAPGEPTQQHQCLVEPFERRYDVGRLQYAAQACPLLRAQVVTVTGTSPVNLLLLPPVCARLIAKEEHAALQVARQPICKIRPEAAHAGALLAKYRPGVVAAVPGVRMSHPHHDKSTAVSASPAQGGKITPEGVEYNVRLHAPALASTHLARKLTESNMVEGCTGFAIGRPPSRADIVTNKATAPLLCVAQPDRPERCARALGLVPVD